MLQKKSGFDVCNLMFIVKYGINADESVRQCCQYDLLQYKWFGWRKFAEYDIRKPDDNPAYGANGMPAGRSVITTIGNRNVKDFPCRSDSDVTSWLT